MANSTHVELLKQGTAVWNRWRKDHPRITPDLSRSVSQFESNVQTLAEAVVTMVMRGQAPSNDTGLSGLDLARVDLTKSKLSNADFARTIFTRAKFTSADLRGANLAGAILTNADLRGADLSGANLTGAMLRWANLEGATLRGAILHMADLGGVRARRTRLQAADLSYCNVVQADLTSANLTGAHIYGVSAWNVTLDRTVQKELSITRTDEPRITVDDLEIGQFLHLILVNRNVRRVIDTLTTKIVVLLGRFTPKRKPVLDALRAHLRQRNYLPIVFDFDRPASRDFTETVVTLAHMARFIIADITDPASVPKELEAIVPRLAVPVQPLIQKGSRPYSMLADYWKYDWVLGVQTYTTVRTLIASFDTRVISAVENKARDLEKRRARTFDGSQ
jgi:pentapeptide repeat protein